MGKPLDYTDGCQVWQWKERVQQGSERQWFVQGSLLGLERISIQLHSRSFGHLFFGCCRASIVRRPSRRPVRRRQAFCILKNSGSEPKEALVPRWQLSSASLPQRRDALEEYTELSGAAPPDTVQGVPQQQGYPSGSLQLRACVGCENVRKRHQLPL